MGKLTKIPRGAMRFVDTKCSSSVFANENEAPKLDMTIYSGKIIKDHWWWGNLAIDLSGLTFLQKKTPILENHDTSKKIAFANNILIDNEFGVKVDPDKVTFVDTEESKEFQKLSKEGFPYQASISVNPSEVIRLGEKDTVEVNGFTMKGPGTVFKKAVINEGSVCVFGWDSKTQSSAFSKEEVDVDINIVGDEAEEDTPSIEKNVEKNDNTEMNNDSKEERQMEKLTLEQLKAEHPDLVTSLTDEAVASVEAKFNKEKEGLEAKIEASDTKLASLEKKDVIRAEKELKNDANSIFAIAFNASDVPEHLFDKVRAMLNHNKFVADEILNTETWKESCEAEILSWEKAGVTDTVIGGGGFSLKGENGASTELANEEKQDTDMADALLANVGSQEGGK